MVLDVTPRKQSLGRALFPLGLVFLATGISTAMVLPFLALFLSTEVHAGPVRITVFLFVGPLVGVIVSTLIGRLSDRRAIRRPLLISAAVAGLISTGLTAFVRDYWILLALTVTATALAGALFPQTFAYAREVMARDGANRAALGISALRTVFSVAWVAGPPLAAFLLRAGGFAYVYGTAAVTYALAALIAIFWLDELDTPATPAASPADLPVPAAADAPEASRWTLLVTAAAFTILQSPLTLGAQALPLFIRNNLGGNVGDAGLILGLCAALEIPLMLGLGVLASRIPLRLLVLGGACCGVAYEALATATSTVWLLAVAQILNASFIAAVSGLGISYLQDMLPRHPGRATTLFTNSFPIGSMMAGPLFGVAQHFNFRLAYVMGTALCAIGLLVLLLTRPQGGSRRRQPARETVDQPVADPMPSRANRTG